MAQPQTKPTGPGLEDIEQNVPEALHPVLQFGMDNLKAIIGVVAGILLVVAAYSGISAYAEYRVERQEDELGRILVQPLSKERLDAARAFALDAPGRLKASALFATAQTAMALEDHEAAIQAWSALAEDAEAPDVRLVAGMGKAKCLLMQGKAAEALADLKALSKDAPGEYAMSLAQIRAAAAEAAGDWIEAVNAYQKLAETQEPAEKQYYRNKIEVLKARM